MIPEAINAQRAARTLDSPPNARAPGAGLVDTIWEEASGFIRKPELPCQPPIANGGCGIQGRFPQDPRALN